MYIYFHNASDIMPRLVTQKISDGGEFFARQLSAQQLTPSDSAWWV